jgi:hypothetical protein
MRGDDSSAEEKRRRKRDGTRKRKNVSVTMK